MIPSPSVAQQGIGSVSADQYNTFTQSVNTAAQLRTFIGVSTMYVLLGGINVVGDGSGGIFYWNTSATSPDDNQNVIVPIGTSSGAWVRLGSTALIGATPIRTTTIDTTVLPTDGIIEAFASTVALMITVPLTLGSLVGAQMRLIEKVDTTALPIFISTDGVNPIDQILAPAGLSGQINGYRWIYVNANAVGGPALRSFGTG